MEKEEVGILSDRLFQLTLGGWKQDKMERRCCGHLWCPNELARLWGRLDLIMKSDFRIHPLLRYSSVWYLRMI